MTNQPSHAPAQANPSATPTGEVEVFAQTVPLLTEHCVGCGGKVLASYSAVLPSREEGKEDSDLYFCSHHIRKYENKLRADGFTITPENTSYETAARK